MSVATIQLFDGYGVGRVQIGNPVFGYPFAQNNDVTSRTITRQYKQRPQYYARLQLGTPDPQYGNMFLIFESVPVFTPTGLYAFQCIYANIPATQITYSSRSISKPTIPNEATAAYSIRNYNASGVEIATAVRNDTGIWLSDDRVFADFVAISAVPAYVSPSGGTFSLTYKTSTTAAFNYNDNNATIAAGLNALASVIADGLTFTVSNNLGTSSGDIGLTITAGSTTTSVLMNSPSLTGVVANGNLAMTYQASSTTQSVALVRVLAVPSHGFSTANEQLVLVNSANVGHVLPLAKWLTPDANTLQLAPLYSAGITVAAYGTINYAADFLRNYAPGVVQITSRTTEIFYLPGSPGQVATPASIPIQQTVISDNALISAILSGGGYQTVAFEGPIFWRESSMYVTANTEVNLDDL